MSLVCHGVPESTVLGCTAQPETVGEQIANYLLALEP